MTKWFSFDGESFETHNTEAEAKVEAERAMEWWADDAGDGWDELSTQVCYGRITHTVRVEKIPVTDDNRHMVPFGCDDSEFELHHLEPVDATCPGCFLISPKECPRAADQPTDKCVLTTKLDR